MSPQDALAEAGQPAHRHAGAVANDFSIQVATVNGSGSQTANLVLLRSIFQMGIPVSGKNLFPSNIAGLPDLVHDPGQPARLHRPQEGNRLPRRDEPGDGARGRAVARAGRARCVYDEPLQAQRAAHRPHVLSRSRSTRSSPTSATDAQAAPPRAQHDLRRHPLAPARHRAGEMEKALAQAAREEAEGDGAEHARALEAGFDYADDDLRQGRDPYGRADEQDGREDPHRGQRRRRARLPVRRRHRRRLVSDHAVVVAVRDADRLPAEVPHRQGDRQGDVRVVQAEDEIAALGMVVGAAGRARAR